jgi:hypothetical protein
MYIDTVTAPAEAPLGKLKLIVCLPSPDIPPQAGGAPLGLKLISATLHLTNVFTLPSENGSYPWLVVATPYTAGTATPNSAGTVQAQGIVRLPTEVSLRVGHKPSSRFVRLSGRLRSNSAGVAGATVTLYAGPSRRALKPLSTARTGTTGSFAFGRTVKRTTYFQVRASADARRTTCTAGLPDIPCAGATLNPFAVSSPIRRVTPRR